MKNNSNFLMGVGVALVTPFNFNGSIDYNSLDKIIDSTIRGGIDYLVMLGTTSESPTLSADEKEKIITHVVEKNNGRVPLVIGLGGNNTNNLIDRIKKINDTHFSAILSVSPYYNRPTQLGLFKHYEKIASNTNLPIILYNVPQRTGSNIEIDTVVDLNKNFEKIIGIKEASGDLFSIMNLILNTPKHFHVISGDDLLALPTVLAGGSGVISVIANAFPNQIKSMIELGLKHNVNESYIIHYRLMKLINLIFEEGNPSGIKYLLSKKNLLNNIIRLPLNEISFSLKEKIDKELELI